MLAIFYSHQTSDRSVTCAHAITYIKWRRLLHRGSEVANVCVLNSMCPSTSQKVPFYSHNCTFTFQKVLFISWNYIFVRSSLLFFRSAFVLLKNALLFPRIVLQYAQLLVILITLKPLLKVWLFMYFLRILVFMIAWKLQFRSIHGYAQKLQTLFSALQK